MKPLTDKRRCVIEATIGPLMPFPRGFARSKMGPFFVNGTVKALIDSGHLRLIKETCGRRRILVSARAA